MNSASLWSEPAIPVVTFLTPFHASKNFFWPKNGPPIGQENLCMTSIKPVYVVHQTCVRGSFFHPSCNKKAAAKNFTPSAWNFFSSWVFANWFALCTERPAPLNSSSLSFCYYSLLLPTQDHLKVLVFFRKFFQVRFEPQQRRALWKNKNWEITQQE